MNTEQLENDSKILTELIDDPRMAKASSTLIRIFLDLIDSNKDGEISKEELRSCFCPCIPKK